MRGSTVCVCVPVYIAMVWLGMKLAKLSIDSF